MVECQHVLIKSHNQSCYLHAEFQQWWYKKPMSNKLSEHFPVQHPDVQKISTFGGQLLYGHA